MRIAISVPAFRKAPDFGGPVAKVALLASGLADRGHDVTVLTADFGPDRSRIVPQTVIEDGYTTHYLRTLARYRWIPVLDPRQLRKLSWDFDVVHVCGLRDGVGFSAIRRARKRGTPYVIEPLGMAPARLRNAFAKRVVDVALTDRQLNGAACVIATSEAERSQLEASYSFRRIDVRPNPITLGTKAPAANAGGDVIGLLFVGRICRTKNLLALVEAIRPLSNVRLTIAGPDDNDGTSEQLRQRAASLPPGRVEIRDWVSGDERDRLIAASTICILPSITENFGSFGAEAASRGRPVIVSSAAGVAGFLGEAAMVVEPTVDALRVAIEKLAGDEALRGELAEAGYQRVAELAPDAVAAKQEQIYRDALRSLV